MEYNLKGFDFIQYAKTISSFQENVRKWLMLFWKFDKVDFFLFKKDLRILKGWAVIKWNWQNDCEASSSQFVKNFQSLIQPQNTNFQQKKR
jgi:hypothetical protein